MWKCFTVYSVDCSAALSNQPNLMAIMIKFIILTRKAGLFDDKYQILGKNLHFFPFFYFHGLNPKINSSNIKLTCFFFLVFHPI